MKNIPQRTCVVCRQMKNKNDLLRIVYDKKNAVAELDLTGKKNGRGAYVCKNKKCIEDLQKKKALNRAFSAEINEDIYNQLRSYIE
ncbi:MAG: RNase P modulator RnpM [Christensenellales bacterium]